MAGAAAQHTTAAPEAKGPSHVPRAAPGSSPLSRFLGHSRGIASVEDASRMLSNPALAERANRHLRAHILRDVQRKFGDRAAQRVALQAPATPARTSSAPASGGAPLAAPMRGKLEAGLGADLSGVRVHQGPAAAQAAARVDAKAFAFGQNIVLGAGARADDVGLMAHEAAHTIQQGPRAEVQTFTEAGGDAHEAEARRAGAAIARGEQFPVRGRTSTPRVQREDAGTALNYIANAAHLVPGFRMVTVILGVNPVNMTPVERTPANVLRALIELMPLGTLVTQALEGYGIFEKVGAWAEQQAATLLSIAGELKGALTIFLSGLSWTDVFSLDSVWERAKLLFGGPISRVRTFAGGLLTDILKFIKDAILKPLAALAAKTDGYDLLKAVLGEDPITGEPFPRTAENIIGPFLKLIGQEEVWENMKKANAIPRVWKWFEGALAQVRGFVAALPALFISTLQSLKLEDLILPPLAWVKIAISFGGFVGQFAKWAGDALWTLLEIVFDSVKPGAMGYVKKTGAALKSILQNPLPFVGNLVKAAKLGFVNFGSNILEHLKAGLINWLVGAVPGVYIPKKFELGEIVKFVFSVLGISWANIRLKLVKVVGETVVKAMETGFDIVVTLVRDGPAAAWEKIKEQLSNLQSMVIGGITDFIIDSVVKKAVPKLIAMFIPGAGFISAIISIYDTVMVFVNKLTEIGKVIIAFIDSIVAIAAGAIEGAAKRVESVLASMLSLAISFLAGFIGLGNVAEKVRDVLEKVRGTIDKALDALINWIVTTAKKLFAKAFGKKEDDKSKKESAQVIAAVQKDLQSKNRDFDSGKTFRGTIETVVDSHPELTAIRVRPVKDGQYAIEASASPFAFVGFVHQFVKTDYGSVVGTVAFDGVLFGAPAYNGKGEHAEDKLIGFVDTHLQTRLKQNKALPEKIEFYVSQSPCKNKCSPNLAHLKSNYPTVKVWSIYFSFLHSGTSGKHAKDSMEALQLLQQEGFHVLQFEEALQMEKKGKAKKE